MWKKTLKVVAAALICGGCCCSSDRKAASVSATRQRRWASPSLYYPITKIYYIYPYIY